MNKILKSILITTASLGTVVGATAAVVSCGQSTVNSSKETPSDEIRNFSTEVKDLTEKLEGSKVGFSFNAYVNAGTFLSELEKQDLGKYEQDASYSDIDFNSISVEDFNNINSSGVETETLIFSSTDSINKDNISKSIDFDIEFSPTDASVQTQSDITPSTLNPSDITPSTLNPSDITPSTLNPSDITPSTLNPSDITPSTLTPADFVPSTLNPSVRYYDLAKLTLILDQVKGELQYTPNATKDKWDMSAYNFDYDKYNIKTTDLKLMFSSSPIKWNGPWTDDVSTLRNLNSESLVWVTFVTVQGSTAVIEPGEVSPECIQLPYIAPLTPLNALYEASKLNSILETVSGNLQYVKNNDITGFNMSPYTFDYVANNIRATDLRLVFGSSQNKDTQPTTWVNDVTSLVNLAPDSIVWVNFELVPGSQALVDGNIQPFGKALPNTLYNATVLNDILSNVALNISKYATTNLDGTFYNMSSMPFDYFANGINSKDLQIVFAQSTTSTPPASIDSYVDDLSKLTNVPSEAYIFVSFKVISSTTISGELIPGSTQLPKIKERVSIGNVDEWNKIIDGTGFDFSNKDATGSFLNGLSMKSFPESEAHCVFSLDGGNTWLTKVPFTHLSFNQTIEYSIVANDGYKMVDNEGNAVAAKIRDVQVPKAFTSDEIAQINAALESIKTSGITKSLFVNGSADKSYYLNIAELPEAVKSAFSLQIGLTTNGVTQTLSDVDGKQTDVLVNDSTEISYLGLTPRVADCTYDGQINSFSNVYNVSTLTEGHEVWSDATNWQPVVDSIRYTLDDNKIFGIKSIGFPADLGKQYSTGLWFEYSTDNGATWNIFVKDKIEIVAKQTILWRIGTPDHSWIKDYDKIIPKSITNE